MKLNKRIGLSILPVLSICYAVFFLGIYQFQVKTLLNAHLTKAQMAANQLVLITSKYVSLGESLHSTLVQSAMVKQAWATGDKEQLALAVTKSLDAVVDEFDFNTPSKTSFLVLTEEGSPAFSLKDDDLSAQMLPEFVRLMQTSNTDQNSKYRTWKNISGTPHLLCAHRVGKGAIATLPGVSSSSDITLGYYFDMPDIEGAVQKLRAAGYTLVVNNGNQFDGFESTFKVSTQVANDIAFDVLINEKAFEQEKNVYIYRLLAAFVAVVLFSALVLMMLIRHYVTGPIMRLQHDISRAAESTLPDYTQSNDEISQLGREFSSLYRRLQQVYDSTKVLAETDTLTQLPNRYTFNLLLGELMASAVEKNKPLAILYIDLDHFKDINDRFGHQTGDAILCDFSDQLRKVMRIYDTGDTDKRPCIARLAGDEFAILLPEFKHEIDIHNICMRIMELFKTGFVSSEGRFPMSASIGISLFPNDGVNAEELMRSADAAMYHAKRSGRNQYTFYSPDMGDKNRKEMDILAALEKHPVDEFSLRYMPIVNAQTNAVVSLEALFRWESATLGSLMPDEFIPIAEAKGIFEKLDYWVVNKVLDDLPKMKSFYGDDIVLSINISSVQLNSPDFFINLIDLFKYRSVDVENIQLEITETFAAELGARAEANFVMLKKAGISVALDDFGTGYTALSQLIDYPLDVVKIDKSLVDRMDDEQGLLLVWALIDFCKQQDFKVVAEGVETGDQAMGLRAAGVDAIQGYYISKPKPISELLAA